MNHQNEYFHLTTIGLSLATLPLLAGLVIMKTMNQDLQAWGEESEEIFRGDRLPLLKFPHD
ncbi:unknown [Crocosphaera subtropica ATCC 51142]|uniref:Uncharacterized protein n=1 Tax=Crocosphaera subtropica (strain ATCC 51142 / BH68) TaxID=43989 RepID=B1WQ39_CROS5|nr:hypothetical protein [Crocosphaera subtropica]ACB49961.1 unknown [Crocosphaera subtropica ATCC 51142]